MEAGFKRELRQANVDALNELARDHTSWWRHVLDRDDLFIAIRNNSLNVYACGQSVFRITFLRKGGRSVPRASIHQKYLALDPSLSSDYVILDGKSVAHRGQLIAGVSFDGVSTLDRWIKAARSHADKEKVGIADIIASHTNVIDLEMGLPYDQDIMPSKGAKRIDLVAVERADDDLRFVFYEAKLLSNSSLRARREPKVVGQMDLYSRYLERHAGRIADAYRETCRVLVEIGATDVRSRPAREILEGVANSSRPVKVDPRPHLLIYGYSEADMTRGNWAAHEARLRNDYKLLVTMQARATELRLPSRNN